MLIPQVDRAAEDVRRFNRFYTRRIGVLSEQFLRSEFSLTEGRVLHEIAQRETVTAGDIGKELGLDAGYLSRILRSFERRGFIEKRPSRTDRRQTLVSLTSSGREVYAPLNRRSHDESAAMLSELSESGRRRLLAAMRSIEELLGNPSVPSVPYVLRPHQPGDMGWIVHRHGVLYAQEYGWDEHAESLTAEITAQFIKNFDPKRERCWIAEREGEIAGSIFLVKQSDDVAKLRLFYVEPSARGLGIGHRLVDECVRFARRSGYKKITLWTNDVLVDARRIYQQAGFRLVHEERHRMFGPELTGQTWDLDLSGD